MEDFKTILKNVSDSYADFVGYMLFTVQGDDELRDDIVSFIKNNPDATSSDILKYLNEIVEYEEVDE